MLNRKKKIIYEKTKLFTLHRRRNQQNCRKSSVAECIFVSIYIVENIVVDENERQGKYILVTLELLIRLIIPHYNNYGSIQRFIMMI